MIDLDDMRLKKQFNHFIEEIKKKIHKIILVKFGKIDDKMLKNYQKLLLLFEKKLKIGFFFCSVVLFLA